MTDARGIPIGLAVAGANQVDFKMAEDTLTSIPVERPRPTAEQPQGLCLDKGYDYDEVRAVLERAGYTPHIRRRGEEIADKRTIPGYRARRWVVERTHSWLNRFRRLLIRWEKKLENYEALLHLAFAIIAFRQAVLPVLPG